MLHKGQDNTQVTNIRRWKAKRGGLFWGHGPSVAGRPFGEDLALFERQVREEAEERSGRPSGPVSRAALSA